MRLICRLLGADRNKEVSKRQEMPARCITRTKVNNDLTLRSVVRHGMWTSCKRTRRSCNQMCDHRQHRCFPRLQPVRKDIFIKGKDQYFKANLMANPYCHVHTWRCGSEWTFHIFLGRYCEYSGDEIWPRFLCNLKITNRRTHSVAQSIPVVRSSLTRHMEWKRGCVPQESPRVLLEETALSPPFQDSL